MLARRRGFSPRQASCRATRSGKRDLAHPPAHQGCLGGAPRLPPPPQSSPADGEEVKNFSLRFMQRSGRRGREFGYSLPQTRKRAAVGRFGANRPKSRPSRTRKAPRSTSGLSADFFETVAFCRVFMVIYSCLGVSGATVPPHFATANATLCNTNATVCDTKATLSDRRRWGIGVWRARGGWGMGGRIGNEGSFAQRANVTVATLGLVGPADAQTPSLALPRRRWRGPEETG